MTPQILFKISGGVIATLGFGIVFKLKPKLLVFATFNGFVTCVSYFFFYKAFNGNDFICNMISAFLSATISEVFARKCKAPSTVFLLTGGIALVPGSSLYYAMYNLMISNTEKMFYYLMAAVTVGVGIGTGIITSSFFKLAIFGFIKKFKNQKDVA